MFNKQKHISYIVDKLTDQKTVFVAINLFSSAVMFTKSFIFLKYLSAPELGLLLLFQAIIALMGLFQLGLFNGGFRILSIDKEKKDYQSTMDSVVTFVLILFIIMAAGSFIVTKIFSINPFHYFLAVLVGSTSLLRNWFTNVLIARRRFKTVNILNLASATASFVIAFSIFHIGILGALLSISSLYTFYVFLFLIFEKSHRPKRIVISVSTIRKLLVVGFVPYLSGMTHVFINQIDRFFVVDQLSIEALGNFYLATTFLAIYDLFPNNINTLFVPKTTNDYSNREISSLYKTAKLFFWIIFAYGILTSLLVVFAGEYLILLFFPDKVEQLRYLILMLPGIVVLSFSRPFTFMLYVGLNLRSLLISDLISILNYYLIIMTLILASKFNLSNLAIGKSIQGIIYFIVIFIAWAQSNKRLKTFYYINK